MLQKLKKSTITLMLVIVSAKLIGMLRDVVLANYFGTSNISDSYLIAVSVPTLLFYFIGHALSTAYLPMYNKMKVNSGEQAAMDYSNNLMLTSMMICAVLVAVLVLFPATVIKLFAAGFDESTLQLTATFVRYSAFSLFVMTALNILGGYLQANSNFILPAMVSYPRNIVFIVSIVIAARYKVEFLGIGILLAYVSELLLLLPAALKNGYRFYLKLDVRTPEMKETLYVVLPIILGVGVSQINKIIDKSIASTVITGGISALSYASIINNAVQEVLVTGIITVLFARCAAWVAEGKHDVVKNKLSDTIQTLTFLLVPASFGVVAVSRLIVKCVLSRGAFDETSIGLTAGALCCYTVGLSFLAVRDTLIKVFYAYKETKITTATSIAAIIVNIVLNLILSRFWGINGLAVATSIAAFVQCSVLYLVLYKKIGDFGLRTQMYALLRIILSSVLMFIIVKITISLLSQMGLGEFSQLIIGVCTGGLCYAVCALLFRIPVAVNWTHIALSKLHR